MKPKTSLNIYQLVFTSLIIMLIKYPVFPQSGFQKTFGTEENEFGVGIIQASGDQLVYLIQVPEKDGPDDDFGLMLVNQSGTIIQSRQFFLEGQQEPKQIIQTSDNGFLVGGRHYTQSTQQSFIVKINENFEIQWSKLVSYYADNVFHLISEDNDGNIYFGTDCDNDSYKDILLIKMDAAGNPIWQQSWGAFNHDHIYDIFFAEDGTLYVLANTWNGSAEIVMICMTPEGIVKWEKSLGRDYHYYPRKFIPLENGEVLIIGKLEFTGQTFLIRMDNTLSPVWAKSIGAQGGSLYMENGSCEDGIIYLAGNYSGYNGDIAVLSMNFDGTTNWLKSFGSNQSENIPVLSNKNLVSLYDHSYIAGSTAGFGTGQSEAYLIRISEQGSSGCNERDLIITEGNINYDPQVISIEKEFAATVSNIEYTTEDLVDLQPTQLCPLEIQGDFSVNNQNICSGDTVDFTDLSLGIPVSWKWYFEGAVPESSIAQNPESIYYPNPGSFDVTLIVSDGLSTDTLTRDEFMQVAPAPQVDLGPDQFLLPGDYITIDAGTGFSSYEWSTGSVNQWIIVDDPGEYWVNVWNEFGCSSSDTVVVYESTLPVVDLGEDITICIGDTVDIGTSIQFEHYLWSTGDTTPFISVFEQGEYWLKVTTENQFENSDTINLQHHPQPRFSNIEFPNSGEMLVSTSGGLPPYEFAINQGGYQSANIFYDLVPGTYNVQIRDANGCTNDTTVSVFGFELVIPNFFTPNGDNIHDTWEIEGIWQFPDATIRIFDRFGKLLTSYRGTESSWDGTYNNRPVKSDTYWFQIVFSDDQPTITGDVTIKR